MSAVDLGAVEREIEVALVNIRELRKRTHPAEVRQVAWDLERSLRNAAHAASGVVARLSRP